MKRRERDLITLFNALWYRDFPVTPGHEDMGKRAVWTTHIASIVKQCADLMGFFTCFETGRRTDAVIQTASRKVWANVEWEWTQPVREKVNEIEKLKESATTSDVQVFIGYSKEDLHEENLARITSQWKNVHTPLIVFLIQFRFFNKRRQFTYLRTYRVQNGVAHPLRRQPALPWRVEDTRWHLLATQHFEASSAPPLRDDDSTGVA